MILDIKPNRDINRNCYEDILALVIQWMGREYEPVFCRTWGFGFYSDAESLGAGLETNINRIEDSVRDYAGIDILWKDFDKSKDKKIITDYIRGGKPVCLRIDRYNCIWSDNYKDKHSRHYCLVIGVKEEGVLLCMDPFYNTQCHELLEEDLEEGCDKYAIFKDLGTDRLQHNGKELLTDMVKQITSNRSFDEMLDFAEKLSQMTNFDKEHKYTDEPWLYPVFIKLRLIANGRKLAAKTMKYLSEKYGVLALISISDQLLECGNQWSLIHSNIIKNCFTSQIDLSCFEISRGKIELFAVTEEGLARELTKLLESEAMDIPSRKESLQTAAEPNNRRRYDITSLYNNKALYDSLDCVGETMNSQQHFVLLRDVVATKGYLKNLLTLKYDNLACEGQKINLQDRKYARLYLEGFSDYSTAAESITVFYSDGETRKYPIEIPNWIFPECHHEEIHVIGSAGRSYGMNYDLNREVKLYTNSIEVDRDCTVAMIELPNCKSLHIFAIYLDEAH